MNLFGAMRLPRSVVFGSGQRSTIGAMAMQIGQRALVRTDERLSNDIQFQAVISDLKRNGVTVRIYDRTLADLPIESIENCVQENRSFEPQLIIGIIY